jgi:ParB/RepB/Spo0J family partition protein
MSDVDKLQNAEEAVSQLQDAQKQAEREKAEAELTEPPVKETAHLPRRFEEIPYGDIVTGINLRTGDLPDIQELALSIKEKGLLQPIVVRPKEANEGVLTYELIDGARRLAAFARVHPHNKKAPIGAMVIEGATEAERYELMFTSISQFRDWEPLAKARALRYLLDLNEDMTASTLARSLGLRPEWVSRHLRLLELPKEIFKKLESGDLSFTVADLLRRGISQGRLSADEAGDLASSYAAGDISSDELRDLAAPPKPQPDPLADGDDGDVPWGSKVWDPEFEEKMAALERAADEKVAEELKKEELEVDADRILSLGGKEPVGEDEVTPYEKETDSVSGPNKRRLYSYLLGRLLRDLAPKDYLAELGITVGEVFDYAWKLDNQARMTSLLEFAEALAEDDSALPTEIFPEGI